MAHRTGRDVDVAGIDRCRPDQRPRIDIHTELQAPVAHRTGDGKIGEHRLAIAVGFHSSLAGQAAAAGKDTGRDRDTGLTDRVTRRILNLDYRLLGKGHPTGRRGRGLGGDGQLAGATRNHGEAGRACRQRALGCADGDGAGVLAGHSQGSNTRYRSTVAQTAYRTASSRLSKAHLTGVAGVEVARSIACCHGEFARRATGQIILAAGKDQLSGRARAGHADWVGIRQRERF